VKTASIGDLLARQLLLGSLGRDDVDRLAGCGQIEVFASGSLLAREGGPADWFYVIRAGRIALELAPPAGGPLVIETLGPGDMVGWSWIFPPHLWTCDVRAVGTTRLIAINGACLRRRCDDDPALGYRLMQRFAQLATERLHATRLRLLDLYEARHAG
jgi:CRP/FNR family cyclic AMP-dependent transcriptional regulator